MAVLTWGAGIWATEVEEHLEVDSLVVGFEELTGLSAWVG